MNAEEKKQYLERIKYHLTMALRLVDNQLDAPASRESTITMNQQVKMAHDAGGEMLSHFALTRPPPPHA